MCGKVGASRDRFGSEDERCVSGEPEMVRFRPCLGSHRPQPLSTLQVGELRTRPGPGTDSKQLHLSVSRNLVENAPSVALRKHSACLLIKTGPGLRRPCRTSSLCLADRFGMALKCGCNSETFGSLCDVYRRRRCNPAPLLTITRAPRFCAAFNGLHSMKTQADCTVMATALAKNLFLLSRA